MAAPRSYPRASRYLLPAAALVLGLAGCRDLPPGVSPGVVGATPTSRPGLATTTSAAATPTTRATTTTRAAATTATPTTGAPAQPAPAGGGFLETFDGSPAAPARFRSEHWNITPHLRDSTTHPSMTAAQGAGCAPPPATHTVASFDDLAFICRGQLGMALDGTAGHGSLTLTPDAAVDFRQSEGLVGFDLSTRRLSSRDWFELWVTPAEDALASPSLEDVDLTGPARRAVVVELHGNAGDTTVKVTVVRNHQPQTIQTAFTPGLESLVRAAGMGPDDLQRWELRLTKTHVSLRDVSIGRTFVDADIAPLTWDTGVVQLQQQSYDPFKDCPNPNCANTWTVDSVRVQPALRFTIDNAPQLSVTDDNALLTFPRPAPSGSSLRFLAFAQSVQVSFDGGRTFVQPGEPSQEPPNLHARSFSTPVPAGTTQVQLRMVPLDGNHPAFLQGAAIWDPPVTD